MLDDDYDDDDKINSQHFMYFWNRIRVSSTVKGGVSHNWKRLELILQRGLKPWRNTPLKIDPGIL